MPKKSLKERFDELEIQGDIQSLHAMNRKEFGIYRRNLKTFLQDFNTETSNIDNNQVLDGFDATKEIVNLKLNDLMARVKKEKFNKSLKGKFGFSRPLTPEKEAAEKARRAKEQAERKGEIEKELEKIKAEKEKIKQERAEKSMQKFGSNDTAETPTFLTDVGDAFSNALIPPLLPWDIEELQRRRDALDELEAVRRVYKLEGEDFKGILETAKRVLGGTGSLAQNFVEETTGGVLKAVTLFLAWPIAIPVKLLNTALVAAKWACCVTDGFLALADKSLDLLVGRFERDKENKILLTVPNILRGASYVIRGPIKGARLLVQAGAKLFRIGETYINFDNWTKKKPVMIGFAVGSVGTILIIGIVVASVFTLGIPIAALAGGLIAATVGAAIGGFIKAKLKKNELKDLELSSFSATQLDHWEHGREHRREQASALQTTIEPKEDEKSKHNLSKKRIEELTGELARSSTSSKLHRSASSPNLTSSKFSLLHEHKKKEEERKKELEHPKPEVKINPDDPDPFL